MPEETEKPSAMEQEQAPKEGNEKKKGDTKKVIAGIAIGGAIGSLIGLLFAPRKGADTRKMIRKGFFSKLLHKLKSIFKDKKS